MSKEYYITLKGVKHVVTEEVYRAYIQPFWKDKKRRQRQTAGSGIPLSLDKLIEDSDYAFDIPDYIDVEAEVERKLMRDELNRILGKLPESDQAILRGLFIEMKTERELAAELGVSQKTVNNKRHRILGKLREDDRLIELYKNF
jgi:RNA polymerase sigma factor (sigma-70 family)